MRTTRSIAAAVLLAMAPVAFSPPVQAQGAGDDATTAMARARFKEGVEFYDKGEFEQARVSFLQAYALKKHPAVLLNLAWSCVKSGHALEADRYFKQFLSEGKDITDKQRADANDGLTQSRAKLGRIEVLAAPGTEVIVDGERVGNVPLADPVVVEAGAHTVKFRTPDGTTDIESITVMGGEKALARFKTTSTVPAAVGPATAPPPALPPIPEATATPPPPPAPPPPKTQVPEEASHHAQRSSEPPEAETGGGGVFAAPRNVLPVILLGGLAVASYGVAGLFVVFKSQAQTKADDIKAQITSMGGKQCPPNPSMPSQVQTFGPACDAFATDNGQVNDDATVGNVLLGVGVAATVGAIIYWLAADKHEEAHASAKPVLVPTVGPSVGGLSLYGQF